MNREALILQAMTTATPDEQRRLVAELNDIRQAATRRAQAARDIELGDHIASAHLTPAPTYVRHTPDTDWLGKVASVSKTAEAIHNEAKAEAGRWFRQTSAFARQHHSEMRVQATGYADVWAGQFGEDAPVARQSFLQAAFHHAGLRFQANDEWDDGDGTVRCEYCGNTLTRKERAFGGFADVCAECREGMDDDDDDDSKSASRGASLKQARMRPATEEETEDYIGGYRNFPGSEETEDGLMIPVDDSKGNGWTDDSKKSASRRTAARSLSEIAGDIEADWGKVDFSAAPYLSAMRQLDSMSDMYGADSARTIVAYFISNSGKWRGEKAKAIKAELKAMMSGKSASRRHAMGDDPIFLGRPITNAQQATDAAIQWQDMFSDTSMSWGEVADWGNFFEDLAQRFPEVRDEFVENGIISEGSRKVAADGDQSYCRICGKQLEQMEHAWYATKASPIQRDVGQHYCVPARLQARPGEFGPDGNLAPGTPGGEGGQYDAPAGTIFDGGGNAIAVGSNAGIQRGTHTVNWADGTSGQVNASRRHAVSLTNVGFEGGIGSDTAHGTDAAGNKVLFRLSPKDAKDLAYVMTSDLAINFSGMDVEEKDIIREGSRRTANTCSVCGDAIASHGDGYHHDNGEKHDHEAKPGKESAYAGSSTRTAASESDPFVILRVINKDRSLSEVQAYLYSGWSANQVEEVHKRILVPPVFDAALEVRQLFIEPRS
jgi:hypothetical protein